jgi:DUF1365 family protein
MRVATPSLIHGEIMHRRRRPIGNAFTYRSVCLALPLAQIGDLPRLGLAYNRRALVSFFDRDHGARDGTALEPWLRRLLAAENVTADGEIVLYAFPRMLGYVFNPVSFWVCHDRAGDVRAVLCEVCNTFGECHNYLLVHPDNRPLVSGETVACRKVFHVSPFCETKGGYRFRFHFAADRWLARIDYNEDADGSDEPATEPLLETAVSGIAQPLSPAAVRGLLWRYRWFTLGVMLRIHWQAVKLWLRRVPYVAKPAPPLQRTTR